MHRSITAAPVNLCAVPDVCRTGLMTHDGARMGRVPSHGILDGQAQRDGPLLRDLDPPLDLGLARDAARDRRRASAGERRQQVVGLVEREFAPRCARSSVGPTSQGKKFKKARRWKRMPRKHSHISQPPICARGVGQRAFGRPAEEISLDPECSHQIVGAGPPLAPIVSAQRRERQQQQRSWKSTGRASSSRDGMLSKTCGLP